MPLHRRAAAVVAATACVLLAATTAQAQQKLKFQASFPSSSTFFDTFKSGPTA